jgi:hypothetical protein
MKPDYTYSRLECYRSVAEEHLVRQQDPQILCAVRHDDEIDEQWPSWVPDWSKNTPGELSNDGRVDNHYRGETWAPEIDLVKNGYAGRECLLTKGTLIDHMVPEPRHADIIAAHQYIVDLFKACKTRQEQFALAWQSQQDCASTLDRPGPLGWTRSSLPGFLAWCMKGPMPASSRSSKQ